MSRYQVHAVFEIEAGDEDEAATGADAVLESAASSFRDDLEFLGVTAAGKESSDLQRFLVPVFFTIEAEASRSHDQAQFYTERIPDLVDERHRCRCRYISLTVY